MSRSVPARTLPLAAAFALFGMPAFAQGTDEQREACAPDAVRLCQDTIPDIPRTTACMKRHEAELSPRCRTAFRSATGGGEDRERRAAREDDGPRVRRARPVDPDARRASRDAGPRDEELYSRPRRPRGPDYDGDDYAGRQQVAPEYVDPGVREYRYLAPNGEEAQAPDPEDRQRARAEIGRLCEDGELDPETCATTSRALGR